MATVYFSKPVTSDLRADVLQYIRDATQSQARMFEGDTLVSPPVNTIRYLAANNRFEKWDGALWNTLNITGNVSPSGAVGDVQFNNGSGAFAGDSGLNWENANKRLYITGANALFAVQGTNPYFMIYEGYGGYTTIAGAGAGGWARGLTMTKGSDGTRVAGIGYVGTNETLDRVRIGIGASWWEPTSAISGITLLPAGNVSISTGADPYAWISTRRALELGKKGYGFTTHTTLNSMTLIANLYEDAVGWKYAAAGTNGIAINIGQNGYPIEVWNAGSGAADATVSSWTNMFLVNPSGNMGIGVSPSAWASGKRALEIGALGHGFQAALGQVIMCQNAYYDGSWKYANTDRAWMLDLGSADSLYVYRAASGTAGAAMSLNTLMVIDNAGTARFIKPSGGLTDYQNGNIEIRTATGDAGIGFHNGGANASSLIVGRSSGIFEFLNNPTSTHQQIKCHNVQTTSYIYGLNGNALNSYGGIGVRGEKNGYGGISFNRGDGTYLFTWMCGTDRVYMGIYDESRGVWPLYTSAFTSTTKTWYWEGNLVMSQNVTAYSDARDKKNVETLRGSLDKVLRMRGVSYERISTGTTGIGVIAQEMLEVEPEVVHHGDDRLSVAYGNLAGHFIEAIKELSARIERLEARHG